EVALAQFQKMILHSHPHQERLSSDLTSVQLLQLNKLQKVKALKLDFTISFIELLRISKKHSKECLNQPLKNKLLVKQLSVNSSKCLKLVPLQVAWSPMVSSNVTL